MIASVQEFMTLMLQAQRSGGGKPDALEDIRPLGELYPDLEIRCMVHYTFVYRFLPAYIHRNPRAFFGGVHGLNNDASSEASRRYLGARWNMMEHEMHLVPYGTRRAALFHAPADLELWRERVGEFPAIILQMPPPELPPAAAFVGCLLQVKTEHPETWPLDATARIFTLESCAVAGADPPEDGVLCELKQEGGRLNYGLAVPSRRDAFVSAVNSVLRMTPPPRATTLPGRGIVIAGP